MQLPEVTELSRPFWEGCRDNRLKIQFCKHCQTFQWYPRALCVRCSNSNDLEWRPVSGNGVVYSFTVVRFPVQTYENPVYFKEEFPYVVGLIELAEGVRMYARIIDCPIDKVEIGMAVRAKFLKISDKLYFPAFQPPAYSLFLDRNDLHLAKGLLRE